MSHPGAIYTVLAVRCAHMDRRRHDKLVPGHDPQLMQRYPLVEGDAIGIAELHRAPHD
jgi:hypothetical protein